MTRFGGGPFELSAMVRDMTRSFSTDWELRDVTDFMARQPDLGTAKREFEKSLESIETNIRWRAVNEQSLIDYLATLDP